MKARLKRRNKFKLFVVRLCIIVLGIGISFFLTFKILYDSTMIDVDGYQYANYLVNDYFGNNHDIKKLTSTEFLFKYSFGVKKFNSGTSLDISKPNIKEEDNKNLTPLVYIYNSHQTEGYKSNFMETFNINNTVYLSSHILGEYLRDLGIGVIVEENSIVDILNTNGWKYGSSYKASRILMENAVLENPSLMFFIDVHRDSSSYKKTMTEIDGKKYAKILFVVGLEHDNYKENLELANLLNNKLKKVNSKLSRGVLKKQGKGVNGKYNQDFNKNTILIEVGGQYNYIDEVNNTLKIMADIIYEYVKGEV